MVLGCLETGTGIGLKMSELLQAEQKKIMYQNCINFQFCEIGIPVCQLALCRKRKTLLNLISTF